MAATVDHSSSLWNPSFLRRNSSSQVTSSQPTPTTPPAAIPSAQHSTGPPTRRSSWISGLHRHSTSNSVEPIPEHFPKDASAPTTDSRRPPERQISRSRSSRSNSLSPERNPTDSLPTLTPTRSLDAPGLHATQSPASGFFSSAFRRFSTSKSSTSNGSSGSGATAPRRIVYNHTTDRPLCPLQELSCCKMKRVAFRVDEIDDEILAKEPLYLQIRRLLKAREASLKEKALIRPQHDRCYTEIDQHAAIAGLDGFSAPRVYKQSKPKQHRPNKRASPAAKANYLLEQPTPALPDMLHFRTRGLRGRSNSVCVAALQETGQPNPPELPQLKATKAAALSESKPSTGDNFTIHRRTSEPSLVHIPHRKHAQSSSDSGSTKSHASASSPTDTDSIAESHKEKSDDDLAKVYARCCKLREVEPDKFYSDQFSGKFSLDTFYLSAISSSAHSIAGDLSPTQAEALADFFAFVPVSRFVVGPICVSDDTLRGIVSSLCSCKHLATLDLTSTKLQSFGWKYICYIVAMSPTLDEINFSGMHRKTFEWNLLLRSADTRTRPINFILNGTDASESVLLKLQAKAAKAS
ncbi:uncharacterized protein V1516DRAFT_682201 [Lipomyces oligophaga]|uniref:uncharacterized protein n=1 Tax=Lipomyces oligophaga TaxID=45792 RepID=UPI0034CE6EE5